MLLPVQGTCGRSVCKLLAEKTTWGACLLVEVSTLACKELAADRVYTGMQGARSLAAVGTLACRVLAAVPLTTVYCGTIQEPQLELLQRDAPLAVEQHGKSHQTVRPFLLLKL
jgi:hypothetical protein